MCKLSESYTVQQRILDVNTKGFFIFLEVCFPFDDK